MTILQRADRTGRKYGLSGVGWGVCRGSVVGGEDGLLCYCRHQKEEKRMRRFTQTRRKVGESDLTVREKGRAGEFWKGGCSGRGDFGKSFLMLFSSIMNHAKRLSTAGSLLPKTLPHCRNFVLNLQGST